MQELDRVREVTGRRLVVRQTAILLIVLSGLAGSLALAQDDVAARLVGRWEGRTEMPSPRYPPERTLHIRSVDLRDGRLVAAAGYGSTGRGLAPVEVLVTVIEKTVHLELRSPEGRPIRLKLERDGVLAGTHMSPAGKDYRIRFEKVRE